MPEIEIRPSLGFEAERLNPRTRGFRTSSIVCNSTYVNVMREIVGQNQMHSDEKERKKEGKRKEWSTQLSGRTLDLFAHVLHLFRQGTH